ncbi:MAG: signal recognition particle-docking protein FtsY [Firmicutes bacterium]|jgi:fused signal recognition particle receptor|nr:signal recognition particle-docking protein FtsY [Bacillota bacterium]HQD39043.1 signal recognition particle-docking protein FtsY [Bacillota bacterium]
MGLWNRLKEGLSKTRRGLVAQLGTILGRGPIDEELYEDLEAILIQADAGVEASLELVEKLREEAKERKIKEAEELLPLLKELLIRQLSVGSRELAKASGEPTVVMIVGVNGAGKTTTAGKLAAKEAKAGRKVLLAAADTFRAGAIEQLKIWAERAGAQLIHHQEGSDPAAVAFDAIAAAKSRGIDTVFVDTAGRLQNKVNLMAELEKVKRVMGKAQAGAPHEVLLVLDATTGQNGLSQARLFHQAVDVSGLVLAKLDGTAKGGIVLAIQKELGLPVKYIGVGEGIEDLRPFDPEEFVEALFEES